jgi:cytochrome P450
MAAESGPEAERVTQAFEDTVRAGTGIIRTHVPGLPFLRWNKGLVGRKVLEDYFRSMLPEKRRSDGDDLFAALCHVRTEDGMSFTDDDVVNHMIFLMMAAHDTSTITATAMSYYLAKHPDWQEQARKESLALGEVTDLASLDNLPTLDMIFQEAMRLVAPVPALVRRTTSDTNLNGYYIPKGTMVTVVPGATHILPELWTEPEDFEPDRFVEPRLEQKHHRFGHIPFGGGAHKCIGMIFGGMEVKALMHRILCEFRIDVPADYEVQWDHTSLVRPFDGLPVTLSRI